MHFEGSAKKLFSEHDIVGFLSAQKNAVAEAINSLPGARVANARQDELICELLERFRINVPKLDEAGITESRPRSIKVDIGRDHWRNIYGRGPAYLKLTEVKFRVPFVGNMELFFLRPTTHSPNPPRGVIKSDRLELSFREPDLVIERARKEFNHQLVSVERFLSWQMTDVMPFNDDLSMFVSQLLAVRAKNL